MNLILYDQNDIAVCVVDTYKSLLWVERYNETGEWELVLTPEQYRAIADIQQVCYVRRQGAVKPMIYEKFRIDTSAERGDLCVLSGRSLESVLSRRLIVDCDFYESSLEDCLYDVLNKNLINPENTHRTIPNFEFIFTNNPLILDQTILTQIKEGTTVYDFVAEMCQQLAIGFRVDLLPDLHFTFELFNGIDRSYGQNENTYTMLATANDTLDAATYTYDTTYTRNVCYVNGDDLTVVVNDDIGGFERREIYYKSNARKNIVDPPLSEDELANLLASDGQGVLKTKAVVSAFIGNIKLQAAGPLNLGDIIQIKDDYGNEGAAIVTEFVLHNDSSGLTYYPTFTVI